MPKTEPVIRHIQCDYTGCRLALEVPSPLNEFDTANLSEDEQVGICESVACEQWGWGYTALGRLYCPEHIAEYEIQTAAQRAGLHL